jgi:hypothetical protein
MRYFYKYNIIHREIAILLLSATFKLFDEVK